jgi:MYXO-CTERM domain-containing protein
LRCERRRQTKNRRRYMSFKKFRAALFAGALTVTMPLLANAQEVREPARAQTPDDDGPDFGWLGLLGLAGLSGLKRRDPEHNVVRDRDRVTHAR